MNEEIIIRKLEGGKNPFRVPEGYFENFNERLASRLPQTSKKEQKTVRLIPRLWRYAAAVILMLGTSTALYWTNNHAEEVTQEEYYNDALDYYMVNNLEIAEYLTEAD